MKDATIYHVSDVGIAVNVAAGHVGEMAGQAIQAAAHTVGCPAGATVGKAVEAAGKAWADTAVRVGTRDASRLSGGSRHA
ncbi:MAG: hypothetical protein ACREM3_29895 [Candidatus Rokuibacteriota bacterium]